MFIKLMLGMGSRAHIFIFGTLLFIHSQRPYSTVVAKHVMNSLSNISLISPTET